MPDVENTEQVENQPAPADEQTKKKKWPLIAGIIVVQVIAAVLLVVFFLFPRYQQWAEAGEIEEPVKEEKKELGFIYTISDLTVNPKNSMGRRFAVFEVALEVKDNKSIEALKKYHPILMDRCISYFRTKTVAELSAQIQMDVIKDDLKLIVNQVLGYDAVNDLYFTRFVLE